MNSEAKSQTYGLQVVVFLSFLALFSLIIAGIVFYGYQSNLDTMLSSSDELLYQISETITRQISSHLEPANAKSLFFKHLIDKKVISTSTHELNEAFMLEALETYPQFQSLYFGDEAGNFCMNYRETNEDGDEEFITKIVSTTGPKPGLVEIHRNLDLKIVSSYTTSAITYDPRDRPWYLLAKATEQAVWTEEYKLFTAKVPGVTCAQPFFDKHENFAGAIGIDYCLNEIDNFLKSMKIGESGTAFICDNEDRILAHPAKSYSVTANPHNSDSINKPRPPTEQYLKTGPIAEALAIFRDSGKYKFNFIHKSEAFIAFFRPLSDRFGKEWTLGIVVPEDDFIGPIARIHETTLLFSFWLLVIAGFLTAMLAKEFTEPIHRAISEANRIQNLDFEGEVDLQSPITEIHNMGETMNSMKKALSAFKKYVPSEIVQKLVREQNEVTLQTQSSKITILFTDISDFSSISEETAPDELVKQLSEYFDCIAKIIHKHNGIIDKYIGDSVMAFWGAPEPNENQAREACLAAIEIQKQVKELNTKWIAEDRRILRTRIGINTGTTLVGNFGSSERFNYTAIGDNVNLASRLEGLNKFYGSQIMVSEASKKEAGEDMIFRVLDIVAVKGRQQSVTVYQLLGTVNSKQSRTLLKLSEMSELALVYYLSQQWEESKQAFENILSLYPDDIPATTFINRCLELQKTPPTDSWDGVYRLKVKG